MKHVKFPNLLSANFASTTRVSKPIIYKKKKKKKLAYQRNIIKTFFIKQSKCKKLGTP